MCRENGGHVRSKREREKDTHAQNTFFFCLLPESERRKLSVHKIKKREVLAPFISCITTNHHICANTHNSQRAEEVVESEWQSWDTVKNLAVI
jgi:hypothetical protein